MNRSSPYSIFAKSFSLIWALFCLAFFIIFPGRISYIYSINLGSASISYEDAKFLFAAPFWGNLLLSISGVALFTFSYISAGWLLAKPIRELIEANSRSLLAILANLGIYFTFGGIFYSSLFLVMAGMVEITRGIDLLLVFAGAILGLTNAGSMFNGLGAAFKKTDKNIGGTAVLGLATLGMSLLTTSARISYDSSAIYFSNAKITAHSQQLRFFLDDTFVASAFQNAIHFTALIQTFGDQPARMFSWVCGAMIIVISLALGEKAGLSKFARVIVLCLLMSSTAFIDLFGDGKVDLINTLSAVAAIYLTVSRTTNNPPDGRILIAIGILAGASIAGRPFNAFLLGIFIVIYFIYNQILSRLREGGTARRFVFVMSRIGAGVATAGIFHLFVNWMIYHDAFAFLKSLSHIDPASGPWDSDPKLMMALRLLYPLVVTFRYTPHGLGNITPLFIIFLPVIFNKSIREQIAPSTELKQIVFIAVITLILWISLSFTVVEIRYVLFLWIIIYLFTARLIETNIELADPFFRHLYKGLLGFLLVFVLLRTFAISIATHSPIDSQGNPKCAGFILCDYLKEINQAADTGDRVLALTAFRYYLRNDLFACSTMSREYERLQDLSRQSPELFWQEVYRQGYSYIAYEREYTTKHLQLAINPLDNLPNWVNLQRLDQSDTDQVAAYKIVYSQPRQTSRAACKISDSGIWEVTLNP